jgi:hypothetical protein
MSREDARAELAMFAAILLEDPNDGDALAGWLIANWWANQPEGVTE